MWQKRQLCVQHQLSSCVILQQYCLHSHGPPVQRLPRNAYYTMIQGGGGGRLSLIDLPAAGSQWHANNTNTLYGCCIDIGREFHGSDRWVGGLPADSRLGAKASRVCDLLHWVSPFRRNCSPGSYKGRISTYRSVNMQGDWKNKQGCSMTTCCWTILLCAGRMTQSQRRTFLEHQTWFVRTSELSIQHSVFGVGYYRYCHKFAGFIWTYPAPLRQEQICHSS